MYVEADAAVGAAASWTAVSVSAAVAGSVFEAGGGVVVADAVLEAGGGVVAAAAAWAAVAFCGVEEFVG